MTEGIAHVDSRVGHRLTQHFQMLMGSCAWAPAGHEADGDRSSCLPVTLLGMSQMTAASLGLGAQETGGGYHLGLDGVRLFFLKCCSLHAVNSCKESSGH